MSEIASASDEQSRGIDQIGMAVTEMDRVTQQNAALVEQSAAAAASLEVQAGRLRPYPYFRYRPENKRPVLRPVRRYRYGALFLKNRQIHIMTGKRFNIDMLKQTMALTIQ